MPARRVAAAPQHGLARRESPAGDALLVLAAQVPMPAARRRPLSRAGGRAPRACDPRERLLRVGAPIRHRSCAARAECSAAHDAARAGAVRALPHPGRGRPRHRPARARGADPRRPPAAGRGEHLPQGDGSEEVVVPAGRCRSGARRRGRAHRVGRRCADPVAARLARCARRGDATAAHRVEGACGARARRAGARGAR